MNDNQFKYTFSTQINDLLSKIHNRDVYLYGAGHGGHLALVELQKKGVIIKGFIDKKAGLLDEYMGYPVYSINSISHRNAFLIVTLMSYNSEIINLLTNSGFNNEIDYMYIADKQIIDNSNDNLLEIGCILDKIDRVESEADLNNIIKANSEGNLSNLFWENAEIYLYSTDSLTRKKAYAKCQVIQEHFNACIPIKKEINRFCCPHGLKGIFISEGAKIGKGCTIFQNVTIGSNTLLDSKNKGFPSIGDKVYIGAGSSIIGNVNVGNAVRIGANSVVTKDIPSGCLVVNNSTSIIQKGIKDNKFINAKKFTIESEKRVTCSKKVNINEFPFRVMSAPEKERYDNSFRITFSGDLILLEDQVKRAFDGNGYEFDSIFKYVKPYIESADLSIGVFEGPMGGKEVGYSTSNYDDGKKIKLNYPDEYGRAVKNAGWDIVTTANNHIFDAGEKGVERTINVMNQLELIHVGSYASPQDKDENRVKIIEKEGIKFAILSYTYGVNNYSTDEFIYGKYSYVTSIITGVDGERFYKQKQEVEEDFARAKRSGADVIVVLPHWGTEFTNYPDDTQKKWVEIFVENGADIILGCHTHTVQPIQIINNDNKKTFVAYSPGNLCNVYRENQGDTSVLIDVYIDKDDKTIIGGSIVPLYTMASVCGNYQAIPIWQLKYDDEFKLKLSTDDMMRIKKSHDIISRVVLSAELDLSSICQRYYFDDMGYVRTIKDYEHIDISASTRFNIELNNCQSVCFIGDSVTEGTFNGGVPWYDPIVNNLHTREINNFSKGGATIKYFIENITNVPNSDLYVVAVGANDIRYRNSLICAMTSEEYIEQIDLLRYALRKRNPQCRFAFITPWYSSDGDPYTCLSYPEKMELYRRYSNALTNYCIEQQDVIVNPNAYIQKTLDVYPQNKYLIDHIHPNADFGVELYSKAVVSYT